MGVVEDGSLHSTGTDIERSGGLGNDSTSVTNTTLFCTLFFDMGEVIAVTGNDEVKRNHNASALQGKRGPLSSSSRDVTRSFFSRRRKNSSQLDNIAIASPKSRSLSRKRLSLWRRKQADSYVKDIADTGKGSPKSPLSKDDVPSGSQKRTRRRIPIKFLRNQEDSSLTTRCAQGITKSRSKDSKSSSVTDESDFEEKLESASPSLVERTKIVAEISTSPSTKTRVEAIPEEAGENEGSVSDFTCATAILGHCYMERICGVHRDVTFDNIHSRHYNDLPEDPTIQESIECIFASQLENGLSLWDDEEETHPQLEARNPNNPMVSPSLLQQSRQNRCDRLATSLSQSKKRYEQASLVYVGTFDPTIADNDRTVDNPQSPIQCSCSKSNLPLLSPEDWPQSPVLLRPTPGKGTKVRGVRFGGSKDYFWEPGSHLTWSECLAEKWGIPCKPVPRLGCCERCAVLPINNGNEPEHEALVVDFESDLFVGSLLLRIRFTEGTTPEPYDDSKGYFKGVNRRYQAVIQGRFKKSIPFIELVTGFQFDRPCGKLPAKWILRGGIKVLSFFAPQLDAKMEGDKPHSLTPLGSTPQVICVDHDSDTELIQGVHAEPLEDERTLLGSACQAPTSLQRARARKKAFDKLFVNESVDPKTDPSKVYTFEFLQHLCNFQDFSIELGSMLGSVELKDVLGGQPLQIMAGHGDHRLWSFDIWHDSLWEDAKLLEKMEQTQ